MYSSTSQLGDINLEAAGSVYQVKTKEKDIGDHTRGVKIKEKPDDTASSASEFFEENVAIRTGRQK